MLDRMNENELLRAAKQLRDEELLAGLARLLRDDRALTARLLVHIGEVDARGLYREHAYASMFEYAVEALHMSESEAYTRIRAARLSREFPVVLGMIAKVQFTADQRMHDKLKQAQALLRHQVPDGDVAAVLERALDLLIAERMKKRFALVRRPRAKTHSNPSKPTSRHIPHEVRREVVARDGQRCSYVSAVGKRCEQRGWLEFHHEEPYGRGGEATTTNIRNLCRAHNGLLAERDYGRAFVQRRIAQTKTQPSAASLVPERARPPAVDQGAKRAQVPSSELGGQRAVP